MSADEELAGTGTHVEFEQTIEFPQAGQLQNIGNPLAMLISDSENESEYESSDDEISQKKKRSHISPSESEISEIDGYLNHDSYSSKLSQLQKVENTDSSILDEINNMTDKDLNHLSMVRDTDLSNILFNYDENLEKQLIYNLQSDSKKALIDFQKL